MRISDWSSDVCSSDLHQCVRLICARASLGCRSAFCGRAAVRVHARLFLCLAWSVHQLSDADRFRARADTVSDPNRSEEHTSELQSLMRISYAVFCLKKKTKSTRTNTQ